ncbi:MAG: phosphoglycerate mutase [Acidimicrobiaceae bacterium]|nr:phosphoglycerate mutase [Acidimicrobiaceae bacterium]
MTGWNYGEEQCPLDDDRMPSLLIILDGLGDRGLNELNNHTPSEASHTPHLDEIVRRGTSGLHLPFGPGRATSSEQSHWAILGQSPDNFPGRSLIEYCGEDKQPETGVLYLYGALRPSQLAENGSRWITGRAKRGEDESDCLTLFRAISNWSDKNVTVSLSPRSRGETYILISGNVSSLISDSDPLFEQIHPWMKPIAFDNSATSTAESLTTYLLWAHKKLSTHPINHERILKNLPPLDVLTTKWPGIAGPVRSFAEVVGIDGGIVSDTNLYRGFASMLHMRNIHFEPIPNHSEDMAIRLSAATKLFSEGISFVLVHVKTVDEAGHTKTPFAKLEVLEALDPAFNVLLGPKFSKISIAITGDHASPSRDGVLHTGDPTPFVLISPTVRPDSVYRFGESFAVSGWVGRIQASDILPILLNASNRPAFSGTRTTSYRTIALPDIPEPMPNT